MFVKSEVKKRLPKTFVRFFISVKEYFLERCAIKHLKRSRNSYAGESVITVAFIVQMPEVWDKQVGVYEAMIDNDCFNPIIYVMGSYDFVESKTNTNKRDNYNFYNSKYHNMKIVFIESEDIFVENITNDKPEYVFYDRPYNAYFPQYARSNEVVKYVKICGISYCPMITDMPFPYFDFGKDTYIWFSSNDIEDKQFRKCFFRTLKYRKVCNLGYPAIEYYSKLITCNNRKFLWTPRWSYDEYVGGSHFFEYIDKFIELIPKIQGWTMVIRPHPLMFDNFVKKGFMTKKDICELKEKCKNAGILFDNNSMLYDTLSDVSFLVSDFSSIIELALAANKPVIYCPSNRKYHENEWFKAFKDGLYVCSDWDEINATVDNLVNNDDSLKEIRKTIIENVVLSRRDSIIRVLDVIKKDHDGLI